MGTNASVRLAQLANAWVRSCRKCVKVTSTAILDFIVTRARVRNKKIREQPASRTKSAKTIWLVATANAFATVASSTESFQTTSSHAREASMSR